MLQGQAKKDVVNLVKSLMGYGQCDLICNFKASVVTVFEIE